MPGRPIKSLPIGRTLCAVACLTALAAALAAARRPELPASLIYDAAAVRDGDLIFRRGASLRSQAVLQMDGGPFSHVGVIVRMAGAPFVAHAAPGASGSRLDPLEAFLDPDRAQDAALFRLVSLDDASRSRVAETAKHLALAGRPFDDALDLADDAALYCTELALIALSAGAPEFEAPLRVLDFLGVRRRVLMPSDLAAALEPVAAFRPGAEPKP